MPEWIQIGKVMNSFRVPGDPAPVRAAESIIEIREEFVSGLKGIEEYRFLEVVYLFHLETDTYMVVKSFGGEEKGIFATRESCRPSKLGISSVHLLGMEGNRLRVIGLDAIDGSPVIDIRPSDRFYDQEELRIITGQ